MQITVKEFTDTKKKLLSTLGVPKSLFRPFKIETDNYLQSIQIKNAKGELASYRVDRQRNVLEYLNTFGFDKPRVFVFESSEHYLIARQIALYIFGRVIGYASQPGSLFGQFPYWMYLNSRLNEEEPPADCSMLVMDNATVLNQSVVRLDKMRDTINAHIHKPIIIVVQGSESTEWLRDTFGVRPYGIIHCNGYKKADNPTSVIRI